jgi:dATP pyrophosphohydrolase
VRWPRRPASSAAHGTPLADGLLDWGLENIYEIYPRWLHRYAPGITHNTEHLFSLQVPVGTPVP